MAGSGTGRTLLSLSLSSSSHRFSFSLLSPSKTLPLRRLSLPQQFPRVFLGFRPICSTATDSSTAVSTADEAIQPLKHSILLERLRLRHLKDSAKTSTSPSPSQLLVAGSEIDGSRKKNNKGKIGYVASSFEELQLSEEVLAALVEMGISTPTEIQSIGIPAVLEGTDVVLGSHTGSGKTLAYLLPLVQLLRRDEASYGILMRPRRPRAIVLCPTRELCEQVFRVSKSISHHARFRSTMVSGGSRLRPQEDSLNAPIDMVVGTPGRVLQHIEEGNIVYGDIKYLVLDEADTMFDRGFGPDIRKFLGPLKNRVLKPDGQGFQTILVTATMTKAVQTLVDEEFQGIVHLRTSTLHKKIAAARHDFIKLSGSENKMEALLQVLQPSLTKGNRVMVFCNTLNSSRAVDHFLDENQISTVNYHGEVPAEQRVENLKKFKSDDGDCPTLVCTDLAARGLDLDVDHVIMFDFPLNSIDYLHRTGRTARMGAKGKVTSLVAKKNLDLATRIEEAIRKNESLESLTVDNVRRDIATKKNDNVRRNIATSSSRTKDQRKREPASSSSRGSKVFTVKRNTTGGAKYEKTSSTNKATKTTSFKVSKPPLKSSSPRGSSSKGGASSFKSSSPQGSSSKGGASSFKSSSPRSSKEGPGFRSSTPRSSKGSATTGGGGKKGGVKSNNFTKKLNVVGFRGKSSSSNSRRDSIRASS